LAQANIDVRIVDAGNGVDQRMRASTFHPPTLDMLDTLGTGEKLVAAGLKVPVWQMRRHETGEYVSFDLGAIADRTNHPYRLQVEQHRYCAIAVAALKDLGVKVEFGKPVDRVEQDEKRATAICYGGAYRIDADWVIGADGASSTVRESLGLDYGGKTYTHSSVLVLTTYPFHKHLIDLNDVNYCWSLVGPFSLLRLKQYWRASLYPAVENLEDAADDKRVRDWFEFISPQARDARLLEVMPYRVHERCVDRFRVGRVILAGDAAHLNAPSGGMGMNGGIHDAVNLAEKLIAIIGGDDESLLDRYERQRRYAASERVIPQASANRERMSAINVDAQARRLTRYQNIASDPERCKRFLLDSSMVSILDEANRIE
jgi:3-(3-hydroxy-phenyl)propionate hydroxylase